MKKLTYLLPKIGMLLVLLTSSHSSWAIDLTANDVKNGQLPSNHKLINFKMYNGNYVRHVKLPTRAKRGTTVNISTQAALASDIHGNFSVLPRDTTFGVRRGQTYQFKNDGRKWHVYGSEVKRLTPNSAGNKIPFSPSSVIFYNMYNGNWSPNITLPELALDDALLVVKSDATYNSKFNSSHQLYPNYHSIKKGDTFVFKFDSLNKKWLPVSTPTRYLSPRKVRNGLMPKTTGSLTQFNVRNGDWTSKIKLPTQANDRDRVKFISTASFLTRINTQGVDKNAGTLSVKKGDTFEFMYEKSERVWKLLKAPTTTYRAIKLKAKNGHIPIYSRHTKVNASNGNWIPTLSLSRWAMPGDRVTVSSSADWKFNVIASDTAGFGNIGITKGEEVQFLRVGKKWTLATDTISMLLVYSNAAASRLGESAAKARLYEGFRLTNEALRNSNTRARLKLAGIRKHTVPGADNETVLSRLRYDKTIVNLRKNYKADAVYYEGNQTGCGLAYVNATPNKTNMVGVGTTGCGTSVMRHEFGHNMGLRHCEGGRGNYGHGVKGTVMCGNSSPYFSSPKLYDDYLRPLGKVNKHDSSRAIDENAKTVSKFF